jgi:hypothetical protein
MEEMRRRIEELEVRYIGNVEYSRNVGYDDEESKDGFESI